MIDLTILNKNMETLGLTLMEDISNRNIGTGDKMKFKDSEGYMYNLSYGNVMVSSRRNGTFAKYLKGNPYTIENIKRYLILNCIDLELLSGDITSAKQELLWKCTIHGDTFNRCWNAISNGNIICPISHRNYYTYEQVKAYIEVESNSGCKLLSKEYKHYHSKLHIECSCGNDFYRELSTFKGTPKREGIHKCKKCTGATIKYTTEQVAKKLGKYNIELLSEYKNYNGDLLVKYNCGFATNRSLVNIIKSEYKCPHCIKKGYGRDTKRLTQEIHDVTNGEYKLLSEYKTMNDKVTILHNECGNIYEITPHHFLDAGNRCPKCSCSRGEKCIHDYFKLNKINNISQYEYEELVGVGGLPLKFDFAILDNENNLVFQLEYDGEFHYLPIKGQACLDKQQEHDRRKDEYCKLHNIDLLRIPYWDFDNIETILGDKLNKKELI